MADKIEQKIQAHTLSPGELLPSVEELAGEHDTGPTAVKHAFSLLHQRGLIAVAPGLGWRVAPTIPKNSYHPGEPTAWTHTKPTNTEIIAYLRGQVSGLQAAVDVLLANRTAQ